MTASEAKNIADNSNKIHIANADAELIQLLLTIEDHAKDGDYALEYSFDSTKHIGLVNQLRNLLEAKGFETELSSSEDGAEWILTIDWSRQESQD